MSSETEHSLQTLDAIINKAVETSEDTLIPFWSGRTPQNRQEQEDSSQTAESSCLVQFTTLRQSNCCQEAETFLIIYLGIVNAAIINTE